MALCYSIKYGDIGLLRHAMREICVILHALSAHKPRYAREMLRQLHSFVTKAANPQLQEAYLANALVNPRGLQQIFCKMDLLLSIRMASSNVFAALVDFVAKAAPGNE